MLHKKIFEKLNIFFKKNILVVLIFVLSLISISEFVYYYQNGLGLAYNDARSHLDIGRRVVEGLNTGVAQIGSVWLPLDHLLMVPTIWNDFMWHSGLAGAIQSMISYVLTGVIIFLFLKEIKVGVVGRLVGVALFALNPNILYLQSTPMTELLLIATMMAGCYFFLLWYKKEKIVFLLLSAFFIMLSTMVRYDGWFLLFFAAMWLFFSLLKKKNWREAEGKILLFCILGGFGIFLWLLWNQLIFHDPFYFIFGQYSAYAQQKQMELSGILYAKNNWIMAFKVYIYAVAQNVGIFNLFLAIFGAIFFFFSKKIALIDIKYASLLLLAPLLFNVLALYLGHTIIIIPGVSGDTVFNIRYGIMMMPMVAIFVGFIVEYLEYFKLAIVAALLIFNVWSVTRVDAVTLFEPQIGLRQEDSAEIGQGMQKHAQDNQDLILISSYAHDSSIFSSMLPMKRFILEGSGKYYDAALQEPDHLARWIVMKTDYEADPLWHLLKDNPVLEKYEIVEHYNFADIYEIKDEYKKGLISSSVIK